MTYREQTFTLQVMSGELRVDSSAIAEELKVEPEKLCQYILGKQDEFLKHGVITLQTALTNIGRPRQYILLNKGQCNYLCTTLAKYKGVKALQNKLDREFHTEETFKSLDETYTPINLNELREQGLIGRKSKGWYSISDLNTLPKVVSRKILELKSEDNTLWVKFDKNPTARDIKEYFQMRDDPIFRNLLLNNAPSVQGYKCQPSSN